MTKEKAMNEDVTILENWLRELNELFNKTYINNTKERNALAHILSDYKRVLKENEGLKEYIFVAPNLDKMTATKYMNIQKEAYVRGKADEQQRAEQIIYEIYISKQKVKDKIKELANTKGDLATYIAVSERIKVLEELLEEIK